MTGNNSLSGLEQVDRLQKLLSDVYLMTGQMLADAARGSAATAEAHGLRLKRSLPVANSSFQSALDALETQITVAQAVMRRDLVQLRARQMQPSDDTEPFAADVNHGSIKSDVDMAGTEHPRNIEKSGKLNGETSNTVTTKPEPNGNAESAIVSDTKSESKRETEPLKAGVTESDSAPAAAGNPIDFDALFNDDMSIGGAPEETKTEPSTKQDPANDQAQTNNIAKETDNPVSSFSFELFNEQNPSDDSNKQDDLSSLLPGLESYANEGQEFNMSEANAGNADNHQQQQQQQQQQNPQQQDSQGQIQGQGQAGDQQGSDMVFGDLMDFGNDFNNSFDFGGDASLNDSRFDDDFFNIE